MEVPAPNTHGLVGQSWDLIPHGATRYPKMGQSKAIVAVVRGT